jgi:hypothetical protein
MRNAEDYGSKKREYKSRTEMSELNGHWFTTVREFLADS